MSRHAKIAAALLLVGTLAPVTIFAPRAFRAEGTDDDSKECECQTKPTQEANVADGPNEPSKVEDTKVCPLADMMHLNGYCTYYAILCPSKSPTSWQGIHGTTTGDCSTTCFPRAKKGEEYLKANHADENLKKKGYPLENGDENVPMQWTQDKDTLFKYAIVRRVNYRYVTYENPDTRHAEIIEYQFMYNGTWSDTFYFGFEIQAPSQAIKNKYFYQHYKKADVDKIDKHYLSLSDGEFEVVTHKKSPE